MSERLDVSEQNWEDGAGRAHLARYYLARGFLRSVDTVIDAACGYGYGSRLLSQVAAQVLGVDYSATTIQVAESRPYLSTVRFQRLNLDKQCEDLPACNVIVTLETLEHLEDPEKVAAVFRAKAQNLIIFSVPLGETPGENPFHKHTFTKESAVGLVAQDGWKMFHSFRQGAHYLGIAYK